MRLGGCDHNQDFDNNNNEEEEYMSLSQTQTYTRTQTQSEDNNMIIDNNTTRVDSLSGYVFNPRLLLLSGNL